MTIETTQAVVRDLLTATADPFRMGSGREVSLEVQNAIIRSVKSGIPQKDLARQFNLAKSTISKIVRRFEAHGCVVKAQRSGRPKKTSDHQDRLIVRLSKLDPSLTSQDIQKKMVEMYGIALSQSTTKNRLRVAGLFGRRPSKKPFVNKKNRAARLAFAKAHVNWTVADWKKVVFSDESKFNLFGSDGANYVRRPKNARHNPKYLKPTVKHGGGNVMVWGCFSANGAGPLHRVQGKMDAAIYHDIISKVLVPYGSLNMPNDWIFQHDNDPKHTAGLVKNYLHKKKIRVLPWPSQSPDLNPIEHLWDVLERHTRHKTVRNGNEKFEILTREWAAIGKQTINTLIESMPRRCRAVIESRGYPTKY